MTQEESILEQYKMYVEMADRVSARRAEANRFFITILSALLALATFVFARGICPGYEKLILIAFSALGLLLNGVWFLHIRAYRQLNSGKFKVIHEMEKKLPFPCYDKEWEILGRGKLKQYRTLTKIEAYIPAILSIPYLLLLLYSVLR